MKNPKNVILVFTILLLSACKDFIEVDPPQDRLVTEKVFRNDETAVSAIGGLYASMMTDPSYFPPYSIPLYTGLYSDELEYKTSDIARLSLYRYTLNPNDAITNAVWSKGYNLIYQANAIIEGLNSSTTVSNNIKNQLEGEAYFVRAFWHFYLCNLYRDIPLVTTTNYAINSNSKRSSSEEVYQQIVYDLMESKKKLTDKYVGADSKTEVMDRIRPNINSASALLARVYLYQKRWKDAEDEATIVLSKNSTYMLEEIPNVFKKSSKESIWQLQMPTGTSGSPLRENTYEAKYFILIANPSIANSGSALTEGLHSSFQNSDLRKTNWISSYTSESEIYYYPFKYRSRVISTVIDEQSICLRLAELYLIRAEARNNQNNLDGSINDVDAIRKRAGIPLIKDVNPTISKAPLLDSIFLERKRELFCEWGHRWFDIKRTTMSDDFMKSVASTKGVTWSSNWLNWPIPLSDIINNNGLTQNEGYN